MYKTDIDLLHQLIFSFEDPIFSSFGVEVQSSFLVGYLETNIVSSVLCICQYAMADMSLIADTVECKLREHGFSIHKRISPDGIWFEVYYFSDLIGSGRSWTTKIHFISLSMALSQGNSVMAGYSSLFLFIYSRLSAVNKSLVMKVTNDLYFVDWKESIKPKFTFDAMMEVFKANEKL